MFVYLDVSLLMGLCICFSVGWKFDCSRVHVLVGAMVCSCVVCVCASYFVDLSCVCHTCMCLGIHVFVLVLGRGIFCKSLLKLLSLTCVRCCVFPGWLRSGGPRWPHCPSTESRFASWDRGGTQNPKCLNFNLRAGNILYIHFEKSVSITSFVWRPVCEAVGDHAVVLLIMFVACCMFARSCVSVQDDLVPYLVAEVA